MGRNNRRENASRISHDYKVGDKVLLKKPGKHLRKLEAPRTGPGRQYFQLSPSVPPSQDPFLQTRAPLPRTQM
jgi:hypothetical protein